MRALFDVNVLLALFDDEHLHHIQAKQWWLGNREAGWASCPLTQNGFARIVSGPAYTHPIRTIVAIGALRAQLDEPGHAFWPDDISITDPDLFDHGRILGPNQITDVYLLGLAVKKGGRLVTFDAGVPIAAVKAATKAHVVAL